MLFAFQCVKMVTNKYSTENLKKQIVDFPNDEHNQTQMSQNLRIRMYFFKNFEKISHADQC